MDMLKHPEVNDVGEMPTMAGDAPYDKAIELLSCLSGPQMEIMTRTNARMVEAGNVAYNICSNFHSEYIGGKADQIMRYAVSYQGKGRNEVVESLKAGAQAYAQQAMGGWGMSYREIPDE